MGPLLRNVQRARRFATLMAVVVMLAGSAAQAQRSGGRFGGSRSFSSPSRSSSSSFRSSSSSFRSSSSSSYRSSSSSTTYRSSNTYVAPPPPPWLTAVQYVRPVAYASMVLLPQSSGTQVESSLISQRDRTGHTRTGPWSVTAGLVGGGMTYGVFALLALVAGRTKQQRAPTQTGAGLIGGAGGNCEVRRVSIAFDWSQRRAIQSALDSLAGAHNMSTEWGMFAGAKAARDMLTMYLGAARYVCFQSFRESEQGAEGRFAHLCQDVNSRYEKATRDGARRVDAFGNITAQKEEGEGLVVVTIVVGSTTPLAPLPLWPDAYSVHRALQVLLPNNMNELVALEVVWSPSLEQDRLSSAELERLYPELVRMSNAQELGRVVCRNCRCVFAAELGKCPSCSSRDHVPAGPAAYANAAAGQTKSCMYCRTLMPHYETQCQHCGGRTAT